jgi:hypothetical protein
MFRTYTAFQWLLIDAANNYGNGIDKLLFEERINWATDNFQQLEAMADKAETYPLYCKAVQAIRKAQRGIPTGHMVGMDGICSGIQIMSCMTGCHIGAYNTGLINDNFRADAYNKTTEIMNGILQLVQEISRKDAKNALMTSFYGSTEQPIIIFGADTEELEAFYQAAQEVAPGAWELKQDLLASWQAGTLMHSWLLPDGFDARIKVMTLINSKDSRSRVEVDELDHATFTYEYKINEGTKKGKSNVANVTHSMDAWVLRSMHRRCNYDATVVSGAAEYIASELFMRSIDQNNEDIRLDEDTYTSIIKYKAHYERSTIADVVILPWITPMSVKLLTTEHLAKLGSICAGMLQYKPFPIITIHDEFKAHANNVNWMRWQYKEILADIADSEVLSGIMNDIYGDPTGHYAKLSHDLGDKIRQSNYGLC